MISNKISLGTFFHRPWRLIMQIVPTCVVSLVFPGSNDGWAQTGLVSLKRNWLHLCQIVIGCDWGPINGSWLATEVVWYAVSKGTHLANKAEQFVLVPIWEHLLKADRKQSILRYSLQYFRIETFPAYKFLGHLWETEIFEWKANICYLFK